MDTQSQLLANTGAARQIVPDRTDWFTLQDANRFTARRQELIQRSRSDIAQSFTEPKRGRNGQNSGSTIPLEEDIIPVEIEVGELVHICTGFDLADTIHSRWIQAGY